VNPLDIAAGDLLMRPWRQADAPAVAQAYRDREILMWNPPAGTIDLAAAYEWVAHRADWSDGDHASFAITRDGALLGSVSLHRINPHNQDAAIGYWVVPAARGQAVAPRAVHAVTQWAFDSLGLHRIELCHAVANAASCRVAAKAGFPLEGTLRESYRYGDGRRFDEHLHARLVTDPAPTRLPHAVVAVGG
jgi:RimJ/RimL family protein N-acetyltransferase